MSFLQHTSFRPTASVAGVPIHTLLHEHLTEILVQALSPVSAHRTLALFTLNPEIIISALRSKAYAQTLAQGDLNVVDGMGLALALKLRSIDVPSRLCGSDIVHDLVRAASMASRPVLIIGGQPERLKRACTSLADQYPGLKVEGISPPFSKDLPLAIEAAIEDTLDRLRPGVVAVCLGAPKQEAWIIKNRDLLSRYGVRIAAGLGGTVDFLSGEIPRAPQLLRRAGMEWLYRLWIEPSRFRRQIGALPSFAAKAIFGSGFITKMRSTRPIYVYAHYAPPHPSASATRVSSLAKHLAGHGHAVSIITSSPGPSSVEGIPVLRANGRLGLLRIIVGCERSAILVTSPPGTPAAEVAMAARIRGHRVVVDIRDPFVSEALSNGDLRPGLGTRIKYLLEKSLFRSAHAVSFVSLPLQRTMEQLMSVHKKQTAIAPNGVDRDIFRLDSNSRIAVREALGVGDRPVFVYSGILGGKSLDEAFHALIPALEAGAHLVVIAVVDRHSEQIKRRLIKIISEAGHTANITWLENLSLTEVARHLNASDAGINTLPQSRLYCLPVKSYEYLACGLYNIAFGSQQGALAELLDEDTTGCIVSEWSLFSNKARDIARNIDIYRAKREIRAKLASHFDREVANRTLEKLLQGT